MEKEQYIRAELDGLFRTWMARVSFIGAGIFLCLAFLDYVSTPENFREFLRYRLLIAVFLVMLGLVFAPAKSRRVMSVLTCLAVIASAATIETMILRFGGHQSSYYVGLILLGICVISFLPTGLAVPVLLAAVIHGIYLVPILAFDTISNGRVFFTHNFFLISTLGVSILLRQMANRNLIRQLSLQFDLKEHQANLEERIEERTGELSNAVAGLRKEIEERRLIETALERSSKEWRTTFDSTRDAIIMLDRTSCVIRANRAATKFFRLSYGDMLGRPLRSLHSGHGDEETENWFRERENTSGHAEKEIFFAETGTWAWITVDPVLDDTGESDGSVVTLRDITEIKTLRDSILLAKNDWEDSFNTINDAITIHDAEFNVVRANKAAEELMGIPLSRILRQKCFASYHGKDCPPQGCPSCDTLRTGLPAVFEAFEPHLGRHIEIKALARFDRDRRIAGLIHVVRDISKRKQDEQVIQTQLSRQRALRSIDRAIISSVDLNVTLDLFLDQVIHNLRIDAANVLLLNRHTHMLEYAVGKGFRSRALRHTRLRLGESLAGRAAIQRSVVVVPDLRTDPDAFSHSRQFEEEEFVSYVAVPLIAKGHVKGVLELFHRSRQEAGEDWLEFLEAIADQGAIAIDNASLFVELQQSNMDLVLAYDTTIEGWSRALDLRDKETEGHTRRVSEMTVHIAREMSLRDDEIVHVRRGALLHDIGKMGVPDSVLMKPGPLSDEEWKIMKLHPVYAFDMLYPIAYLRPAIDIPYHHHEKWDGSGYPKGLRGEEIPLSARIFAVVDVWDALRSDRPYRAAWTREKVTSHVRSLAGSHFDPEVTETFLGMISALEENVVTYAQA